MNKLILTTTAALMILAASCGQNAQKKETAGQTNEPQQEEIVQGTTSAELSSPAIQIERATDEVLNKFDALYEYNDNDYGERIVIWTDVILKNLDFISVGFEDREGQISLFAEDILYSINELSPKKAFVIKMFISEGIPSRGISFLDENRIKKYFYISESGIDGSLSMVEFNNNK